MKFRANLFRLIFLFIFCLKITKIAKIIFKFLWCWGEKIWIIKSKSRVLLKGIVMESKPGILVKRIWISTTLKIKISEIRDLEGIWITSWFKLKLFESLLIIRFNLLHFNIFIPLDFFFCIILWLFFLFLCNAYFFWHFDFWEMENIFRYFFFVFITFLLII